MWAYVAEAAHEIIGTVSTVKMGCESQAAVRTYYIIFDLPREQKTKLTATSDYTRSIKELLSCLILSQRVH